MIQQYVINHPIRDIAVVRLNPYQDYRLRWRIAKETVGQLLNLGEVIRSGPTFGILRRIVSVRSELRPGRWLKVVVVVVLYCTYYQPR